MRQSGAFPAIAKYKKQKIQKRKEEVEKKETAQNENKITSG